MIFAVPGAAVTAGRSAVTGVPLARAGPAGPQCGRSTAQVSLQTVERVVGEQQVEGIAAPLELGEFAHPLQVRRPLDIQVAVGRPAEHQGEHHLGEQLAG